MDSDKQTASRVVVIGGGLSGLSVAVRLAQARLPVTLLERSRLGAAASTRNQGWLHSGAWFAPENPELARWCHRSLQQTLRFCPDCIEPEHEGMAYLFPQAEGEPDHWTAAWKKASIPVRELEPAFVFDRLPGLSREQIGPAFLLPDRAIRNDRLLTRLAAAAEHAGAELRTETPVAEIECEGGRVQSVVTGSGESFAAALVVLAGGTEGLHLCPDSFSTEPGGQSDYAVIALKSHLLAVQPGVGQLPFCIPEAEGFNHVPHAPSSVFGSNRWYTVSNPGDQHVEPDEIEQLWNYVARLFPQLDRDALEVTEWAGTTIQALHVEQVEPGHVPLPTVIDHARQTPGIENLVSVFPGRATLWPHTAEEARRLILSKLEHTPPSSAPPPWAPSAP